MTSKEPKIADWRGVRTGVITAGVVAALAALGGLALAASGTAWRVAGTVALALAFGGAVLVVMRRLKRVEEVGTSEHALEHRLAELEAREILRDYCGAPFAALRMDGENVWGEALRIFSGAIMSGWRLRPGEPDETLPGVRFHPPGSASNAVFVLLLPLSLDGLEGVAAYLAGHGVPFARVSGEELPRR